MNLTQLTPNLYQKLYSDIHEFRETFDLPVEDPSSLDESTDRLHTSLAIEELTELAEGRSKEDEADAIVDTVYVLMGRAVHLGAKSAQACLPVSYLVDLLLHVASNRDIDFVACWDEIHSSNMSKVCRTEQEYSDTEKFYASKGMPVTQTRKGEYLIVKCAEDAELEGKLIRKGKVLKSVYYRPADLSNLV
ncbi:nucleoside triphosphate pyrophosphohydrolase family protein [Parasalinivibrio latis]|uniref:nucleoside triphosphate pyrophosphohydrolase family protein n=1 Tax=Parasalinivibrio latis TaxID=2952610 RepID=UPI0030E28F34